MTLAFIGQEFKELPPDTTTLALVIESNFPTIANAGVKLYKDNGNNTISQIGQGVIIDTSINTPQGDTVLLALSGTGKYVVAFQGQATAIDGSAVSVKFNLFTGAGQLVEGFEGERSEQGATAQINGTAYINLSEPGIRV